MGVLDGPAPSGQAGQDCRWRTCEAKPDQAPVAQREGSGHRRYRRSVLRRIAIIVFAQRIGLTLDEIVDELAKLPDGRTPGTGDWEQLSTKWLGTIDERMAELQRLREGLTNCIGCGCLSFDTCWIANPDDRKGRAGPGPRSWV